VSLFKLPNTIERKEMTCSIPYIPGISCSQVCSIGFSGPNCTRETFPQILSKESYRTEAPLVNSTDSTSIYHSTTFIGTIGTDCWPIQLVFYNGIGRQAGLEYLTPGQGYEG
jgi:hypothetical protein